MKPLQSSMNDIPEGFVIGRLYHCSWASRRGYVWRLVSYDLDNDKAELITPKTGKQLFTKLSSLREVNDNIKRI